MTDENQKLKNENDRMKNYLSINDIDSLARLGCRGQGAQKKSKEFNRPWEK